MRIWRIKPYLDLIRWIFWYST